MLHLCIINMISFIHYLLQLVHNRICNIVVFAVGEVNPKLLKTHGFQLCLLFQNLFVELALD